MLRALVALFVLLVAAPAWAVPAYDSAANNAAFNCAGSTCADFTGPTVVSGSNGYVIVFIASDQISAPLATGVTYDGNAMTNLGSDAHASLVLAIQAFGITNSATGGKAIAFAGLNTAGLYDYLLCAVAFTGVNQTTPAGTPVFNEGTASNPSTVTGTTAANGLNAIFQATQSATSTVGSGVTAMASTCARSSASVKDSSGGTSTQDTNTFTHSNDIWDIMFIPLNPVTTNTGSRTLIGVGN